MTAADIVDWALACYRTPLAYQDRLSLAAALPEGMDRLLWLANGSPEALEAGVQQTGARPQELRDAARFCVQQLCFARNADPYRVLGVEPGAPPERIKEHYRLLMRLQKRGTAVHDRTTIARIEVDDRGATLTTSHGAVIKAKTLVMAAGYASQQFLKKRVAKNRSSYAFMTDPIDPSILGPLRDTMVWESARPYLYMRTTGDGRLLVGGDDDDIDIPARRDALVDRKARKLAEKVSKLFPDVPVQPAFAWAGTFAETEDGLPWIGASPEHGRRLLFAMAYGGNGITYSMLGAGLVRALVERRKHPLQGIFGFERMG